MKKKRLLALLMICSLVFTGCGSKEESSDENAGASETSETTESSEKVDSADMFSNRDFETDYDEEKSAVIELNGSSASCDSDAVKIDESTVTITDEGTYILRGTLDDGMIIVNAEDADKPQLVLDNVSINSETSAAIYILEADKVFITMAEGSENTLSNGGTFEAIDDNNIDAAVFSKQDLTFNGNGTLTVSSPADHGIVCKDDLVFTSGTYNVSAASQGLDANDSVRIADGVITVAAGKDGIHAENSEDEGLGFVYIAGGTFDITAEGDGMSASSYMQIEDGTYNIVTGGGSENGANQTSDSWGGYPGDMGGGGMGGGQPGMGGGHGGDQMSTTQPGAEPMSSTTTSSTTTSDSTTDSQDESTSIKGIKVATELVINGGTFTIDSADDAVHSNSSIVVNGGDIYMNASGDGIDANGTLEITGGYTVVCGPTTGDTATLDYDSSAVITGGTFIGTGASQMAQTFSDSEQGVVAVSVGNQNAGTEITLTDASGNVLISYTPELSYGVVILSSPDIVKGETYTITVGEASGEFEAN